MRYFFLVILTFSLSFTISSAETLDVGNSNKALSSGGWIPLTQTSDDQMPVELSERPLRSLKYLVHNNSNKTLWFISCYKKEFDNTKVCHLHGGDLWVYLINGKYSVSVGSDIYPGTRAGFRVDNGKSVYGYEGDFSNPLVLINQLKKGKFVYTRYQEWPYLAHIDKKTDLEDFNEKFNEMLNQYKML